MSRKRDKLTYNEFFFTATAGGLSVLLPRELRRNQSLDMPDNLLILHCANSQFKLLSSSSSGNAVCSPLLYTGVRASGCRRTLSCHADHSETWSNGFGVPERCGTMEGIPLRVSRFRIACLRKARSRWMKGSAAEIRPSA